MHEVFYASLSRQFLSYFNLICDAHSRTHDTNYPDNKIHKTHSKTPAHHHIIINRGSINQSIRTFNPYNVCIDCSRTNCTVRSYRGIICPRHIHIMPSISSNSVVDDRIMGRIRSILMSQQDPLPLEPEVVDYLMSVLEELVLESAEDDGDKSEIDDEESTILATTLNEFLSNPDDCQAIHALVRSAAAITPGRNGPMPADQAVGQRSRSEDSPLAVVTFDSAVKIPKTSTTQPLREGSAPGAGEVLGHNSSDDDDDDDNDEGNGSDGSPRSNKDRRKERRLQRRKDKMDKPSNKMDKTNDMSGGDERNVDEAVSPASAAAATSTCTGTAAAAAAAAATATALDDHATAWQERKAAGLLWGGRGHGGRGVRVTGGENIDHVHLPSVSLQYHGHELLVDSIMDINKGHRYGLLGRNGVGKSTLLRQLMAHNIPGLPHSMRILLVSQQIQGRDDQTALEALLEADVDRTALLQEQERVEDELERGIDLERNAIRLGDIVAELDAIDADGAEDRATTILKGLGFTKEMRSSPTSALSGGWRMRLALAQALIVPSSDLILLDEVTNHLDLHGLNWLTQYLTDPERNLTLMVVSHDRAFLGAICTDIIVMAHQRLTYHMGNYWDYERQMQEKSTREAQILDATERQQKKAVAFVQKQQQMANKKSADPNKQRQAKMIKDKKMDRIGMYREDGKKFKNMSLKKMDMASYRGAQKVHIERDDPVIRMKFPEPDWTGIGESTTLIQLEDVGFSYNKGDGDNSDVVKKAPLLDNLTLSVTRGTKVALVGRNGCGKSTLVKLLSGDLDKESRPYSGKVTRHPNIRIGYVSQYSVEDLERFADMTLVEYAEEVLKKGRASSNIIAEASGNVRQYLGAFGLGGSHAHRLIGQLSGGERMRACFATVLADEPHLLLLDESTNHVDLETLDSMADALHEFTGAVVMVSHNQGFLSGFCNTLWVLEDGRVDVIHNDTDSFDELFSQYKSHVMSGSAAASRSHERRAKADMAKRATKQSAGTLKTATFVG